MGRPTAIIRTRFYHDLIYSFRLLSRPFCIRRHWGVYSERGRGDEDQCLDVPEGRAPTERRPRWRMGRRVRPPLKARNAPSARPEGVNVFLGLLGCRERMRATERRRVRRKTLSSGFHDVDALTGSSPTVPTQPTSTGRTDPCRSIRCR